MNSYGVVLSVGIMEKPNSTAEERINIASRQPKPQVNTNEHLFITTTYVHHDLNLGFNRDKD